MQEREKRPLVLNDQEPSISARMLDRVIRAVKPERYGTYHLYWHLMRATDNLVDQGESSAEVEEALGGQRRLLRALLREEQFCPQTILEEELKDLALRLPNKIRAPFILRYSSLLTYFDIDLKHRMNIQPYGKEELDQHIEGGFTAWFGGLKMVLYGRDLSGNPLYLALARVHGEAEPLRDIDEDLERGLVLHSRENGAHWVDRLKEGEEVPVREINEYVLRRRGSLAKVMHKLAPEAFREFGGLIGFLMTVDYYKRSVLIGTRWRFTPKEPVVFAKHRMQA